MNGENNKPAADSNQGHLPAPELLKKMAIWLLFIGFIYLTRDFFFTAFMTFLFSYLALGLVDRIMRWLPVRRPAGTGPTGTGPSGAGPAAPGEERAGLRRLLTVGVFVLVPIALVGLGVLILPSLLHQAQHLAGWLSHVNPETEVAHLVEQYVGPAEFKRHYSGPDDPAYRKDFADFQALQVQHVKEYQEFPKLETWVQGGFGKQFVEAETGRTRARLLHAGLSSQEFEEWFRTVKLPALQDQVKKQASDHGGSSADPLVHAAATMKPDQLLQQVRHDPAMAAALREEWIGDAVKRATAAGSPAYLEHFRAYYEARAKESPKAIPYTFDQYIALRKARASGPRAFGETYEKLLPAKDGARPAGDRAAAERADFEAAKSHELFREWWATNSVAKFIRHQVEATSADAGSSRLDRILAALLNLPVDLATALLLSFFICIDYPQLCRALAKLRETWLRDVYDEIAPVLSSLGQIIGRALHAQGLIALCNAVMMFIALNVLGVEHPVLLSCAVFVLCLVPSLGMIIAWVLIAAVALVQPGGGLTLVLQVSGAVLLVVLLETFVFSPRILGRMMELHPVLIIALLPVAQYFFGVWGLILATPVAVYVVHVIILQRGLPGSGPSGNTTHENAIK